MAILTAAALPIGARVYRERDGGEPADAVRLDARDEVRPGVVVLLFAEPYQGLREHVVDSGDRWHVLPGSASDPDEPMRYERDGELFEVSTTHGVTYRSRELYGARRTLVHVDGPVPADVVASTVVELNLAGWTLVTDRTDGGE